MGALSNPRHERFAQETAKGLSASDACRAVGIDPRNSTRLTKNDEIAARVEELKERSASNVMLSRPWTPEARPKDKPRRSRYDRDDDDGEDSWKVV